MTLLGRKPSAPKVFSWKRNLFALWLSQFLSLTAFNFCMPFMSLYLRESGIVPAKDAVDWAGFFVSVGSIGQIIMSPIWGSLGDRYGRKMMLVRANLSGAFVMYLMGLVDNIEALIILRIFQGAFTGTVPAAQTLVSTNTPDRNQGFATGVIMAAVNAGTASGQVLGGLSAKYYGPANSFKIAGLMLLASTVISLVWVGENFTRPEPQPRATKSVRWRRRREGVNNFVSALPILGVMSAIAFLQSYDGPFLSLYIDSLYRASTDPAVLGGMSDVTISGEVYALAGQVAGVATAAAVLGSILTGIVMDRKLPFWTWSAVSMVSGMGAAWIGFYASFGGLALGRAIFLFFVNGLASVMVVVLSRLAPPSRRGAVLGWAFMVRAFGWALAPLTGAFFAGRLGWSATYYILAGVTFLMIPAFLYFEYRYKAAFHPIDSDPPAIGMVGQNAASTPTGQGRMS